MAVPRVLVVTDSTADIPPEIARQLDITVIPANVQFGSESFLDGVNLSRDEFYRRLVEGPVHPTTASPAVGVFAQAYRDAAAMCRARGDQVAGIVSIHPPAALSALQNSAWLAAQEVPEIPVRRVDSQQVSTGTGILAVSAARDAARGLGLDEVAGLAEDRASRTYLRAMLNTLEYVRRSGRLGAARWLIGTLLHIKPIIGVYHGVVQPPLDSPRTRSRGMDSLVEMATELAPLEDLAVVHARAPEMAGELMDRLSGIFPRERMLTGEVGVTIGAYAGPGAVGFMAIREPSQATS